MEGESAQHMQNIYVQKELTKLAAEAEKSKLQAKTSQTGKTTQSPKRSKGKSKGQ